MSAAQPLYVSVRSLLARATELAAERGLLAEAVAPGQVALERPKQASHGDLATNLFFGLAKAAKTNPRTLAEACLPLLTEADHDGLLAGAEVAGPGFVNLRLSAAGWQSALTVALQAAADYGQSNAGGGEFQALSSDGSALYEHVARRAAADWSRRGDVALVVGATYPSELARVREIVGEMPLLVPGVGAQGGDPVEVVRAGKNSVGAGLIVNSSRAILYADANDHISGAARVARETRDALNAAR